MFKLYEIANDYMDALENMEDVDEEIKSLEGKFEEKAIGVAKYVLNLEAEASAIAEAIKRMEARKASCSKKAIQLRAYLKREVELTGINPKCPELELKIRKNPPRVDIQNEEEIPDEYKSVQVHTSISRSRIARDLKSGVSIPGASLAASTRLEIK